MRALPSLRAVAHIRTDFPDKFGVPRQSGLADELRGRVVFEKPFRVPEAVRGLEGYSHLWLLWLFSRTVGEWPPTVRPPRLGGNARVGVFASRSPHRPNPIGLSCVRLERIDYDNGPTLYVRGADLVDGTPIVDIKPYVPYADCRPDATGGYAVGPGEGELTVEASPEALSLLPPDKRAALLRVLALDPRPGYQHDPERIYGLRFAGLDVRFWVQGETLRVLSAQPDENAKEKTDD